MLTTRGDNLLLSVPQMDREHLTLLALENEFSVAVDSEASRAELEMRLTQLIEGFKSHFESEEWLMRSNGFPELKMHRNEHLNLEKKLSMLRDDLGSGVVNRCSALIDFVRLLTGQHIQGADTELAHFLHMRGRPDRGPQVGFLSVVSPRGSFLRW
jgi:hemerythrin-like metal-binding protein